MKLIQNIKVFSDHSISTWLSQEMPLYSAHMFLAGPYELSFHPFELCAWASLDFSLPEALENALHFSWRITIIDDEEKKALLNVPSSNRALLMLSELFGGLSEYCASSKFVIESIKPELKNHTLTVTLSIPAGTNSSILVADALCLKVVLDAMLFCRGLALGDSFFESREEGPSVTLLKAIFLARL